jgi:transcriptional regulatory protein GAL4
LAAWYALCVFIFPIYAGVFLTKHRYFLFQASLVPVFCLRNAPLSENAGSWRLDIEVALNVIESMFLINSSSLMCYDTIYNLYGEYLTSNPLSDDIKMASTQESPQTQISNVYSMMWPNVPAVKADVVM